MMASVRVKGAVEAMAGHFVGRMIRYCVQGTGHIVAADRAGGHQAVAGLVRVSNILQQQLFYATITAGMTYTVLNDFCIALGVAPVHKPIFYSCMRGEPNVREGWNAKVVRQGVRYCDLGIDTVMRSGRPVTLMVDGRYDSTRSAQHCTVTAIECDTRLVVGVHTLRPKKEGKASDQLEVPAVVRLLRGLLSRGLKIRCIVSDDCAALGPQLERLGIEWQKDGHHKLCRDEGGDFVTLHNDVMMIADHWAGDHSRGEDTIARDEEDVASGADPDVVGDDDVFIIGDGDGLPVPADAVSDRSCDSPSDADDVELFDD
ncbi:hypothetical protein CBR_g11101 [Chara braunii]|uniref:Uncharacterized protein n=1 Tax=Chara braunii TaxID=69332 RepID=A0A388KQ90_CHABU|nr:hypothetical protein CBR_g11101 [Chara braunii]|eukprot:GBG72168.1 hypothetical protein CBR_g11101 [Chara braunii]